MSQSYANELVRHEKVPSLELALRIERETGGMVPPKVWIGDQCNLPDMHADSGQQGRG